MFFIFLDISSGFASSGDFSNLLNRLAIEVDPADRTLTPRRASQQEVPFQDRTPLNPFQVTSNEEEPAGNYTNPFNGYGWCNLLLSLS